MHPQTPPTTVPATSISTELTKADLPPTSERSASREQLLQQLVELWNKLAELSTAAPNDLFSEHSIQTGSALHLARRKLGLSQKDVAKALWHTGGGEVDLSLVRRVSYIEAGSRKFTSADEERLSTTLPDLHRGFQAHLNTRGTSSVTLSGLNAARRVLLDIIRTEAKSQDNTHMQLLLTVMEKQLPSE